MFAGITSHFWDNLTFVTVPPDVPSSSCSETKKCSQSVKFPLQPNTQTQIRRLLFCTMNTEDGHARQDIQWMVRQAKKRPTKCGAVPEGPSSFRFRSVTISIVATVLPAV